MHPPILALSPGLPLLPGPARRDRRDMRVAVLRQALELLVIRMPTQLQHVVAEWSLRTDRSLASLSIKQQFNACSIKFPQQYVARESPQLACMFGEAAGTDIASRTYLRPLAVFSQCMVFNFLESSAISAYVPSKAMSICRVGGRGRSQLILAGAASARLFDRLSGFPEHREIILVPLTEISEVCQVILH